MKSTACFVLLCMLVLCRGEVPVLHCVGCDNVTCPPEPTNCYLDRIPCGCCNVCALGLGERCQGFSASCGPGLVCLTPAGTYDERPPWFSVFHGICVYDSGHHHAAPTLAPTLPTTVALAIGHQVPTLAPPLHPVPTVSPVVGRK
uniref:Insulin-like growth factor binding protein 5 n=1 Tax=Sinonovacula constricta TaxID=98310 RepID=A0A0U2Q6C9_SINCO|nr:insulin-like growth factor binding protein 5 [Sinonovacula constricta]ALL28115.1 insulin-like growth factor binding protein 5 [Sinonovacula constricta]